MLTKTRLNLVIATRLHVFLDIAANNDFIMQSHVSSYHEYMLKNTLCLETIIKRKAGKYLSNMFKSFRADFT
jgi:hypothetical protein